MFRGTIFLLYCHTFDETKARKGPGTKLHKNTHTGYFSIVCSETLKLQPVHSDLGAGIQKTMQCHERLHY